MVQAQFMTLAKTLMPAFVLAHLTHHIATSLVVPLSPFLRDDFTLSYSQIGFLGSAFSLAYGLSQLPMGRLADMMSKRLLITLGLIGVAIPTFLVGLTQEYLAIVVLLVITGILGGTYHPTASPLISQYFGPESRGRALGLHFIGGNLNFFLTPVLAGFIAMAAGWRAAFLILAIPSAITGLLFWFLLSSERAAIASAREAEAQGPELSIVEVARRVGVVLAIAMLSIMVVSVVQFFLPIYLVDKHSVPREFAGMLVGLITGAGIIAAPVGGALSDRLGRIPVILFSIIASGPLIYLITVLPFGIGMIITFIILGLVMTSRFPVLESLVMDLLPPQRRSTVMGFYYFLNMEVGGVATPLVGYLIDQVGLNQAFTILAIVALATSGLVLLVRRRV